MSTQPAPGKARLRRRSAPKVKSQQDVGPCGRRAPAPPPFLAIQFSDGATLLQSTAALSRTDCPHCVIDRLVEHGYLEQVEQGPLLAPYPMHGDGRVGQFGPFSGLELTQLFVRLSVPGPLRLGSHLFDFGGC
jgi:hypothetical protein